MTFPAYPAYIDSGVEWLGEVPDHWSVTRLGRVTGVESGYPFPAEQFVEDGIPVARMSDLKQGRISLDSIKRVERRFVPAKSMAAAGDLLIGLSGSISNFAQVSASDLPLAINQRVGIVRAESLVAATVAKYFILSRSFVCQIESAVPETTILNISMEQVRSCALAWPPKFEQTQIARFLDHETARIDALIEEQQRLIELLKEKRQAVISHAVTKGLDPTVSMKDTGVEWLGEVPAHWDVVPTNYRYEIQLGRMLNEQRAQGDHLKPYLRVFDVQWNAINTADLPLMDFPPEVQSMYRLRNGDLMVNEGGSYIGRSAIWRGDLDECYYQKALHRLRARNMKTDTAEFFLQVMEMATQRGVFVAGGNQTTIDHLTAEQLRQYRFAFPPLEEQLLIAEKITDVVSKIQNTTSEAEQLIGYLKERRSALISATVTGKIDVRGWQPPARTSSPELEQEAV